MKFCTYRCLIRRFKEQDLDDFMTYRNDMDWMKYQGFKGMSKQGYRDALLQEHLIQNGFQLAIICKKNNALIGDVYLKQEDDTIWIGYSICRAMARQGYAHEVVLAIISSLRNKGIKCFKAGVDPSNLASIALLKKLNFSYAGIVNGEEIFILKS